MANPNDWFREVFGEHFPLLYKKLRLVQKKLESEDDIFTEAIGSFKSKQLSKDGMVALFQLFSKKDIKSLDEDCITIEHWAVDEIIGETEDCLKVLISDWPEKFQHMVDYPLSSDSAMKSAFLIIKKNLKEEFQKIPVNASRRYIRVMARLFERKIGTLDGYSENQDDIKELHKTCQELFKNIQADLPSFAKGPPGMIQKLTRLLSDQIKTMKCCEDLKSFAAGLSMDLVMLVKDVRLLVIL
eukprot:TRINITY_DN1671_c0_g2_i4.p1 TRINITY_DN1671_c0_g2~~TRINITY_DN1671_c0_g2_i4.p1  ORF type:complete len:242 (-),score=35.94 TRINITY_DN1671_c0_g2_i4:354-1079(-)